MLRILLSSVTILASLVARPAIAANEQRPNFVIIMADDMGYGDAGCYGSKQLKTPHLDRLAANGMKFTDFHSSGNVCSPTRAGLLTGRYQYRAGIPGVINADPAIAAHHLGLESEETTFAEMLEAVGYRTGIFGKWHLGYSKKYNPTHQGFERFRGFVSGNIDYLSHYDRMETYDWWDGLEQIQEDGYSTHLITKHAIRFIEQHKDEPFCLYVAHEAVHSPWQGPNDPIQRGPNKGKPTRRRAGGDQKGRALSEMMTEMDKGVGQVVAKVKQLGLEEKTVLFFFSDNGPAGGSVCSAEPLLVLRNRVARQLSPEIRLLGGGQAGMGICRADHAESIGIPTDALFDREASQ